MLQRCKRWNRTCLEDVKFISTIPTNCTSSHSQSVRTSSHSQSVRILRGIFRKQPSNSVSLKQFITVLELCLKNSLRYHIFGSLSCHSKQLNKLQVKPPIWGKINQRCVFRLLPILSCVKFSIRINFVHLLLICSTRRWLLAWRQIQIPHRCTRRLQHSRKCRNIYWVRNTEKNLVLNNS